jgi:hypothetical protein
MDIEGDPHRNFYYLIGMLVATDSTVQHHSFWADTADEEIDIVTQFLEQMAAYDGFRVFHYGAYETKFLKKMKARLNGAHKAMLDRVTACASNILERLYPNVYFPTYSNELKEIGRFLGCSWTEQNASGLQSLVWRYQWEADRREELKARLIKYNHEDCLALKQVVGFLSELQQSGEKEDESLPAYAYASNLAGSYPYKQFRKVDFCIPEMEYINRCAYFDYQHDKVSLVRSVSKGSPWRAKRRNHAPSEHVNKTVELARPAGCPTCGSQKVYANQHFSKKVTDLKFSRRAVKRWTVQYRSKQYRCPLCHGTFSNSEFKEMRKYGHGLVSWVVYFNVALNLPLNRMIGCLTDVFGISLSRAVLQNFKKGAAGHYLAAYLGLVRAVQNSRVIYADETQVKIGRESHYVWVFTNTREVVFAYSESREGSFLKEFLDGFKGVLVSDFYAVYDSIDCPQQKCL